MDCLAQLRQKIILNCELLFIDQENIFVTTACMKRGDSAIYSAYAIGQNRVTLARSTGASSEKEALETLLQITTF